MFEGRKGLSKEELIIVGQAELEVLTQAKDQFSGSDEQKHASLYRLTEELSSSEIAAATLLSIQNGFPTSHDDSTIFHQLHDMNLTTSTKPRVLADLRKVAIQTLILYDDSTKPNTDLLGHKYFIPGFPDPTQAHSHKILRRVEANVAFAGQVRFIRQTAQDSDLMDRLALILDPQDTDYFQRYYRFGPYSDNPASLSIRERKGLAGDRDLDGHLNNVLEMGRVLTEMAAGIVPGTTRWILASGKSKQGYTRSGKRFLKEVDQRVAGAEQNLLTLEGFGGELTDFQQNLIRTVSSVQAIGGRQIHGLNAFHETTPHPRPGGGESYARDFREAIDKLYHPNRLTQREIDRINQGRALASRLKQPGSQHLAIIQRQMLEHMAWARQQNMTIQDGIDSYNQKYGTNHRNAYYYYSLYRLNNPIVRSIPATPTKKPTPTLTPAQERLQRLFDKIQKRS